MIAVFAPLESANPIHKINNHYIDITFFKPLQCISESGALGDLFPGNTIILKFRYHIIAFSLDEILVGVFLKIDGFFLCLTLG